MKFSLTSQQLICYCLMTNNNGDIKMALGLSDKAMREIIKAEIDMTYVAMFGTWHIKVKGEQVISSTLWYDGDKYITYDLEDNYINLCELSMERPHVKLQAH